MEVIEFYSTDEKVHWLEEMKEADWDAGQWLAKLIEEERLKQLVGENTKVLMLVEGEKLISFCTLAEKDDIQPTDLTPWIGWVYTFTDYRGNHYAGKLLQYAEECAKEEGMKRIHISTNHNGLYEKYGYEFFKFMKDMHGDESRVYVKNI